MKKSLCEISNPKQWKTISTDMLKDEGYPVYGANGIIGYYSEYNHEEKTLLITCRGATCGSLNICEPYSYVNGNAMALDNLIEEIDIHYLYYYLLNRGLKDTITGTAQPQIVRQSLQKVYVEYPELEVQCQIVNKLNQVTNLINKRKKQLSKLDELVKARFVELFGDPITNSNNLPTERMEQRFSLKAGITTSADDIHDFEEGVYEIPCYGGNGIRGYVKEKSYTGDYPIIGRQGALCGNVQYATGDFHATEHAVLVSLLKNDNSVWVYHLLKLMDLYRYHTGAAQPGLAVKTLNTVEVIVADKSKQDQFAAFVKQTDKSKLEVQKSLEKLELLKKALMQKYFG